MTKDCPIITDDVAARFWAHVDKAGACWTWSGYRQRYGRFRIGSGKYLAHRIAYAISKGQPGGMHVLHRCDNTACVNPEHLFLGDHSQNMLDRDRKGRGRKGERAGMAKLSYADVQCIRSDYIPRQVTLAQLAREYGVIHTTILSILSNRSWHDPEYTPRKVNTRRAKGVRYLV